MSKTGYIYRLTCVNTTIKERYVGSTWDMKERNKLHKSACQNTKNKDYNAPVYKFIRENGGYDNWYMVTLDCVECEDHELVNYEQHYIDIHGGIDFLLNAQDAVRDTKKYREEQVAGTQIIAQRHIDNKDFYCKCCDHAFQSHCKLQKHLVTNKHKQQQQTYDFLSDIENSNPF